MRIKRNRFSTINSIQEAELKEDIPKTDLST